MLRLVQVVQAYMLLERMPAAVVSLLVQHMLHLSADQRQQLRSSYVSQRQQLERQLEQHKHGLHPSMLSVARWAWTQHMAAGANMFLACCPSCIADCKPSPHEPPFTL